MHRTRHILIGSAAIATIAVCGCASAASVIKQVSYDDGGRRDPFVPLIGKNVEMETVQQIKSPSELVIEGILVDKAKESVVVVNGRVLKVGNYIGGFRVDEIRPREVVFSRDGQKATVTYGSPDDMLGTDKNSMFANFDSENQDLN